MKSDLYMYDWVIFLYSRNWHTIVNQLYLIKKKTLKREDVVIKATLKLALDREENKTDVCGRGRGAKRK